MGARALSPVRPALEHDPHDSTDPPRGNISIDVDTDRALDALRAGYGDGYPVIDVAGDGTWWALRRDGLPGLTASGPDGLLSAILTDVWPART